ncbi:MAG: hypothetical protein KDA33_11430 [Phycisphaerales bacterium]|nr:hypothetical protein [Phycisphaerales bacterium]
MQTLTLLLAVALMLALKRCGYWLGPAKNADGTLKVMTIAWPCYIPLRSIVAFTLGWALSDRKDAPLYDSQDTFYEGIRELIGQLRAEDCGAEADALDALVFRTAWTTGSELLGALVIRHNSMGGEHSAGVTSRIRACAHFAENHRKILGLD